MSRNQPSVEALPVHLEVRVNGFTTLNFEVDYPVRKDLNGKGVVWVKARKCHASAMVHSGAACTLEFPDSSIREGVIQEIEDRPDAVALRIRMD